MSQEVKDALTIFMIIVIAVLCYKLFTKESEELKEPSWHAEAVTKYGMLKAQETLLLEIMQEGIATDYDSFKLKEIRHEMEELCTEYEARRLTDPSDKEYLPQSLCK